MQIFFLSKTIVFGKISVLGKKISLLSVSSTEFQIYIFYVENVLRATQTRVVSHPDVGLYVPVLGVAFMC